MASHVAQAREAHTVLGLAGVRFLVGHAVLVSLPFSLPALFFPQKQDLSYASVGWTDSSPVAGFAEDTRQCWSGKEPTLIET